METPVSLDAEDIRNEKVRAWIETWKARLLPDSSDQAELLYFSFVTCFFDVLSLMYIIPGKSFKVNEAFEYQRCSCGAV